MAHRKGSADELVQLLRELQRKRTPRATGNPFPYSAVETGIGKLLDALSNAVDARVAHLLTWLEKRKNR